MRAVLDSIYRGSGVLSAILIVAIVLLVLFQIFARLFHIAVDVTDVSAFLFCASSFLALAYAFKQGAHIRVVMLLQFLHGGARRAAEVSCAAFGAAVCGYFTWHAGVLVYQSFTFGEKTQGLWVIPLWIPQLSLPLGLGVLTLALVDEGVQVLAGKTPEDDIESESAAAMAVAGATPIPLQDGRT